MAVGIEGHRVGDGGGRRHAFLGPLRIQGFIRGDCRAEIERRGARGLRIPSAEGPAALSGLSRFRGLLTVVDGLRGGSRAVAVGIEGHRVRYHRRLLRHDQRVCGGGNAVSFNDNAQRPVHHHHAVLRLLDHQPIADGHRIGGDGIIPTISRHAGDAVADGDCGTADAPRRPHARGGGRCHNRTAGDFHRVVSNGVNRAGHRDRAAGDSSAGGAGTGAKAGCLAGGRDLAAADLQFQGGDAGVAGDIHHSVAYLHGSSADATAPAGCRDLAAGYHNPQSADGEAIIVVFGGDGLHGAAGDFKGLDAYSVSAARDIHRAAGDDQARSIDAVVIAADGHVAADGQFVDTRIDGGVLVRTADGGVVQRQRLGARVVRGRAITQNVILIGAGHVRVAQPQVVFGDRGARLNLDIFETGRRAPERVAFVPDPSAEVGRTRVHLYGGIGVV